MSPRPKEAAAASKAAREAALARQRTTGLLVRGSILLAIAALGWFRLRACGAAGPGALAKAAAFFVGGAVLEALFRRATQERAGVAALGAVFGSPKAMVLLLAYGLAPYAALLVAVRALTRC